MERGLHKAVLFRLPTHSEGFLCFGCLLPPTPNTQPIFLFLALLLLCLLLLSLASLQDVAELRLPPLSTGTVSLSNQPAARRNAPLHQPRPGTGSFSKQIPRPSASGSNVNRRVGKSVAHHLAYVSSNSHTPGFPLQAYEKKKPQRKHGTCNTGFKFASKTLCSTADAEKRERSSPGRIKEWWSQDKERFTKFSCCLAPMGIKSIIVTIRLSFVLFLLDYLLIIII